MQSAGLDTMMRDLGYTWGLQGSHRLHLSIQGDCQPLAAIQILYILCGVMQCIYRLEFFL